MLTLTKDDLKEALTSHRGNDLFGSALELAVSQQDLFRLMGSYIEFNSVFGGGVANLAGEIAERQDIFFDKDEVASAWADRSVVVASPIYAASVAEFGGEYSQLTHRSLAQATLKGIAQYFQFEPATVNVLLNTPVSLQRAILAVQHGYGLNRELSDMDLFHGIGFHIGSECLADEEFNIMDRILKTKWGKLVAFLKETKVSLGADHAHPAYDWVSIHTTVEADHYSYAMTGANFAMQYYQGNCSPVCVRQAILDGFAAFANMQTEFMGSLAQKN